MGALIMGVGWGHLFLSRRLSRTIQYRRLAWTCSLFMASAAFLGLATGSACRVSLGGGGQADRRIDDGPAWRAGFVCVVVIVWSLL